jgi:hypothetical protein
MEPDEFSELLWFLFFWGWFAVSVAVLAWHSERWVKVKRSPILWGLFATFASPLLAGVILVIVMAFDRKKLKESNLGGVPVHITRSEGRASERAGHSGAPIDVPGILVANCSKCGKSVLPTSQFCSGCGTRLDAPSVCKSCGLPLAPGTYFCSRCGTPALETKPIAAVR